MSQFCPNFVGKSILKYANFKFSFSFVARIRMFARDIPKVDRTEETWYKLLDGLWSHLIGVTNTYTTDPNLPQHCGVHGCEQRNFIPLEPTKLSNFETALKTHYKKQQRGDKVKFWQLLATAGNSSRSG